MRKNTVKFIKASENMYGPNTVLNREEAVEVSNSVGLPAPAWLFQNKEYRGDKRGTYVVPSVVGSTTSATVNNMGVVNESNVVPMMPVDENILVPQMMTGFVGFGEFSLFKKIVKSDDFTTVYITGLSGNGKTVMVNQACAVNKTPLVRVNFTEETCEDDLIGGWRLENGDTVFEEGPVIRAMRTGATLLLDEVDLASSTLVMCLQSILEGTGYYIKKTQQHVSPAPGFKIFATGNTKGKGNENGQFIGTNILNEAFLDRFDFTIDHQYPDKGTELKIIQQYISESLNKDVDKDIEIYTKSLVDWAATIRKAYTEGSISDVISTRRLKSCVKAYTIFDDPVRSIQLATNRFDSGTQESFMNFFMSINEDVKNSMAPATDDDEKLDPNTVEW